MQEFLDSLPVKHRAKAIWEIELLERHGSELREPYVKHIRDDIWELRIQHASDISRIFYFMWVGGRIVLLHGFLKKTRKLPQAELELAQRRQRDYIDRHK